MDPLADCDAASTINMQAQSAAPGPAASVMQASPVRVPADQPRTYKLSSDIYNNWAEGEGSNSLRKLRAYFRRITHGSEVELK